MNKTAVVTGASTGIGHGSVKALITAGFTVFGSVRKQADADRLQAEFGDQFTPLILDVTDADGIAAGAAKVKEALGGKTLGGLVNNAGIALPGPLIHQPLDHVRKIFEVNVFGLLAVTQAFAPQLGADKSLRGAPGRIVNISSAGGRVAAPFVGAYSASKHAVEGLSDSLRRELMLHAIDVIVVGPGAVVTPIWDKAEAFDRTLYLSTPYAKAVDKFARYFIKLGRNGHKVEIIGDVVVQALTAAKPKVRYSPVADRFTQWTMPLLLPKRWVDERLSKAFGLYPQD